ncbi:tRNA preQ1(34) S-adenosylmethionine ribosyltransferase-isomerase QueA [Acidithiobacillus sp. AMEEHan]|uniref:tRNA preQ1(34) S-adenosylmethionine ribosyltransferase-isomerase QueA n=1 Tax=Acidithiobacillus sp. AMEEHan TaxID=2994951 RepID=UPI0027E5011C|nr:tRNA preQ1(34) S-adenosylmethionine ribosyltransferase-isomerase QueA [Acidithiobacillus sp. AMEEHan]
MRTSDFHYELPEELIAQEPLAERAASRMLLLDPKSQTWQDQQVRELPGILRPGDLLVFNDTRVLPARLHARKVTGGAVELLLERLIDDREALFLARASKALCSGMQLLLADGSMATVRERQGMQIWLQRDVGDWLALLEAHGEVPLPPYIRRPADAADRERYQTIFGREPGAVAAPTAGLHFDAALLTAFAERGITHCFVTLHVGAGTFLPVREDDIEKHQMHAEISRVTSETVQAVQETKARGGRVIAVGTTACRALESAAMDGSLRPFADETRLFLYPGKKFHVIDALFTNFHLPESTLMMLVSALAGRELILAAYRHAVAQRYRFFSYGDAMLILPGSLP